MTNRVTTYGIASGEPWRAKERPQFERTGECRAPRKGEWFLAGAIPEAYYAANDLAPMVYHILRPLPVTLNGLRNAAPELYAACKTAEANLAPSYASDHLVLRLLRVALAKAEGKAP